MAIVLIEGCSRDIGLILFVVTDLFGSKTCVMDIIKINVNMGMLLANSNIVMLLYFQVDCNVTKGLLHNRLFTGSLLIAVITKLTWLDT